MAVGADQGVRVGYPVLFHDAARQIFHIDLMDDADAGRHHLEGVKGLHAPLHELVTLAVAGELDLHVLLQRVCVAVAIDLHRVIDDQFYRCQRFHLFGVLAGSRGGGAHGGQVGQERHAGKVLQEDTADYEGDFFDPMAIGLPVGEFAYMPLRDLYSIAVAQYGFEHDADRYRQAGDLADAGLF